MLETRQQLTNGAANAKPHATKQGPHLIAVLALPEIKS